MRKWLPASFIAGALIFSVAVYPRLPERVPIHWGMSGDPDRFGSRIEGAFLLPLLMVVVFLLMHWYPSRDPRAANIAKFRNAYDTVVAATIALLAGMHIVVLGNALGWPIPLPTFTLAALGLLLMLLGNLMPLARSNFIFGIRTPWTLSSEHVWTQSHRVGGYTMVAAGLVTIVSAFIGGELGISIALTSLVLAAVIPVVYSYVVWNRERHAAPKGQP